MPRIKFGKGGGGNVLDFCKAFLSFFKVMTF